MQYQSPLISFNYAKKKAIVPISTILRSNRKSVYVKQYPFDLYALSVFTSMLLYMPTTRKRVVFVYT